MIEDEDDDAEYAEPSELRQGMEESIASGCLHPPVVPGALPSLPDNIDVVVDARNEEASPTNVAIIKTVRSISVGTANLGRTTKRRMKKRRMKKRRARKASNWQFPKSLLVLVRVKLVLVAAKCSSTTHRRSSHKDCPYNKKHHMGK